MEVRSAAPNGLGEVLMPGDSGQSRWSVKIPGRLRRARGAECSVDRRQVAVCSRSKGTLTQICITRGFRNFCHYGLAADLTAGGLNLQTPRLLPN